MRYRGRIRRVPELECMEQRTLLSVGWHLPTFLPPGSLDSRFGIGGVATETILGPTQDRA
jgi:hypothetical protein